MATDRGTPACSRFLTDERADLGLPKTIRLSPEDLPPDDEPVEDVRDE